MKVFIFKKAVAILVFDFTSFTFFMIVIQFALNFVNSFNKIINEI